MTNAAMSLSSPQMLLQDRRGRTRSGLTLEFRRRHAAVADYELRFPALHDDGCAYAFPCDAAGHVDIDALSDKARDMYFYARLVVGRVFSRPTVQPCVH